MHFKYLKHLASLGMTNIHPGGDKATEQLISSLDIKDGHHILDFGCGTGETMVRIASSHDVSLTGIDALPEMIKASKKRVRFTGLSGKISISQVSENSPLPFSDGRFDRVFTESALCFQDLQTARSLLKEIHRVLKEHGIFAANEAIWKDGVSAEKINEINRNAERDFGLRPSSPEPLYLKDWLNIFQENGFDVLSYDLILKRGYTDNAKLNLRIFLSKLFSLCTKSKILLNPALLKEHFRYKKVIKKHERDTPVLEGRIFVMRKR
jgi:cyclopropane fatty-acyl-phospholipid synthase-like methyltransferase